jgi:hypothetical protein
MFNSGSVEARDKDYSTFNRYCPRFSSVGVATGYGLCDRGSIPGRGNVFLYSIAFRPNLGPTLPLIQWVPRALSPGVKRPRRETDHSPASSAEVKNDGTTIPPLPRVPSWHSA